MMAMVEASGKGPTLQKLMASKLLLRAAAGYFSQTQISALSGLRSAKTG